MDKFVGSAVATTRREIREYAAGLQSAGLCATTLLAWLASVSVRRHVPVDRQLDVMSWTDCYACWCGKGRAGSVDGDGHSSNRRGRGHGRGGRPHGGGGYFPPYRGISVHARIDGSGGGVYGGNGGDTSIVDNTYTAYHA